VALAQAAAERADAGPPWGGSASRGPCSRRGSRRGWRRVGWSSTAR